MNTNFVSAEKLGTFLNAFGISSAEEGIWFSVRKPDDLSYEIPEGYLDLVENALMTSRQSCNGSGSRCIQLQWATKGIHQLIQIRCSSESPDDDSVLAVKNIAEKFNCYFRFIREQGYSRFQLASESI